ncbi:hypothetical protein COV49_02340 [Candidatus Falkowbacteria bacterium CG11_big_fil_rev_8_21_14_0_20_39_10]|uniref:ABC transporter ATP-binding protein n=1 Tax=Candidatus Falkowbacteria bacterium CG11_big_fil_rev_8_21_14_0_20_39_10 TaxID=1974570 RepID=A0A2M6K939_9BACT|nr:MAG: hypothetical protein COV49_02340 [Candidatus Falkowbacteria bacterium CG11_big_fil_rev_8_21_14_0_20_39_10]
MSKKTEKLNNSQEFNISGFWLRSWKLLTLLHKQIKILLVLLVVFELSKFVIPYLFKLIIDSITNFNLEDVDKIVYLIIAMFIAGEISAIIDYFTDSRIMRIVNSAENYLPVNAQKKMLSLSLSYHEKENTGNKISKIQRGVDKIINLLSNFFWDVLPTVIQVILTTGVLFVVDYRFGLIFLFFAPIFGWLSFRLNKNVYPYRKARHDDYEISAGLMAQAIININTVKSFVQEKREESKYTKIRDKIKSNIKKEFGLVLKYNWARNLVINVGRTVIIFFGVYLITKGAITIGSLVFVVTISDKALISLFRISRLYDRIMESAEAIDRLYFLEQEKSNIINKPNGLKPKEIIGQVEFKGVSFKYDDASQKALGKVSLKISSGCVTALVGPSGGGKTTVARMIYRHYDPQAGIVRLDDKDLRDYDLYSFRKFIAIVPQEVEIFDSSVRDNIAYANPGASLREIKAVAKIANAEEFINNLKDGYDTLVGERGIKLSGGQRQRVGIARAILANPRILIFDEATSNLDSYSEKLIQDAISKIRKGRTMIIIAHRLSTIKKADKIIVLENGQIAEQGSHYELAQTGGGLYAKLLKLQEVGDVE